MPPPKPPPGRLQPCLARSSYYGNTSKASSDDNDDDRSFSDVLDRISSLDRTGLFDRVTSKRLRLAAAALQEEKGPRGRAAEPSVGRVVVA
ncbi:uncharacterized protein C2845_PM18G04010 [Panicum miliaceum]|uniref:Uncharacterized protein n=1 Tax=Panicum miliaceum TaxID=4540 RepID=A0A3L6PJA5_PANMI|nr:uncharacterized protein C2845_PM18G04010 [Panicum miliaceum]